MATQALSEAMGAARAGTGGVVFFLGEAGMGKSSLIESARQMAGDSMSVLSARGAAMEGDLAFAFAGQLLDLPPPAARPPDGVRDPLSRRALVHELARAKLRELAESAPLALLLDDLHWADPDSLSLISFLARRLTGLAVAIIGALRPWPPAASFLVRDLAHHGDARVIDLAALSFEATRELVCELVGEDIRPELGRRAFELTRGNPQLVAEAARCIRQDGDLPQHPGPGLARLQQALLLSHLAGLPQACIECARAAAVLGGRPRLAAVQAVTAQDPVTFAEAFDSLVEAGVMVRPEAATWAEFSHELLASALREDMSPAHRRLLHTRAFDYYADLGDPVAAAPHAVAGDLSGDERAVSVISEAALDALTRGAVEVAVGQLADAVDLAGPAVSEQLLERRADALMAAGKVHDALATYQSLLSRPRGAASRHQVLAKAARAEAHVGRLEEALDMFDELARDAHSLGGSLVPTLLERAHIVWEAKGPVEALAALDPPAIGKVALTEADGKMLEVVRSYFLLEAGDPRGLGCLERAATAALRRLAARTGQAAPSFHTITLCASVCGMTERFDQALRLIEQGDQSLRQLGALWSTVPLRIIRLGILVNQGFPLTVVSEADDLEEELDLDSLTRPHVLTFKAEALASLGRTDQAFELCRAVEESAGEQPWFAALNLAVAWGECLLGQGDPEAAAEAYRRVEELVHRFGVGEPCLPPWAAGAVEAALAAGQLDQVERVVQWLDGRDPGLPCLWPRMVALAGRAGLAAAQGDDDRAGRLFQQALALPVVRPLDRARLLVRYGAWLRASRQPLRARPVLAEALRTAEERGAAGLAAEARAQLSAAGGRRRSERASTRLTPQEARVAELARTGATAREIAQRMYLSPRTVETHLARAYRKLGVSSKAELRRHPPLPEGQV